MKNPIHGLLIVASIMMFSCNNAPKVNLDDEVKSLLQTDKSWSDVCASKDVDRYLDFYADDAVALLANGTIMSTKNELRKYVMDAFSLPNYTGGWQAQKASVSKSGDLGYIHGSYDFQWTSETGEMTKIHGNYLCVWQKQVDGAWKAIAEEY